MELCTGDLHNLVRQRGGLTEPALFTLVDSVTLAIDALNSRGWYHTDVKLEARARPRRPGGPGAR